MSYHAAIAHEAEKVLDRLDRPTERRLRARITQLADNPFDPRLSSPLVERTRKAMFRPQLWLAALTPGPMVGQRS